MRFFAYSFSKFIVMNSSSNVDVSRSRSSLGVIATSIWDTRFPWCSDEGTSGANLCRAAVISVTSLTTLTTPSSNGISGSSSCRSIDATTSVLFQFSASPLNVAESTVSSDELGCRDWCSYDLVPVVQ